MFELADVLGMSLLINVYPQPNIRTVDQSICTLICNLSGQPDIYSGSWTLPLIALHFWFKSRHKLNVSLLIQNQRFKNPATYCIVFFQLNSPMDSSLLTISNDNTGDVSNPTIPTLSVMYHTWTIGAPIGGISDSFNLTWRIFNCTAYCSVNHQLFG